MLWKYKYEIKCCNIICRGNKRKQPEYVSLGETHILFMKCAATTIKYSFAWVFLR